MEIMILVTAAAVLDLALGDPPNAFHPVSWMGWVISRLVKAGPMSGPIRQFVFGIVITLFITALFTVPVYYLLICLHGLNEVAYFFAGTLLLKSSFSIRGLRREALKIKNLLEGKNTQKARFELRALVSRNTSELSEPLLVSAAVESVAEGTGDSIVAPLFYFLIFGVPGAIAYRVVNTMDAMIGYHGKYEHLGKFAARLDDVLNFIPARISALLLVLAACLTHHNWRYAGHTALYDHVKTESPNAGWPMAAMAGALRVQLEKPGHYILGKAKTALTPDTIGKTVEIFSVTALVWIVICLATGGIHFAVTS